jgi:hypothetical protein
LSLQQWIYISANRKNDFADWNRVCADGKMILPIGIASVLICKMIFQNGIVSV